MLLKDWTKEISGAACRPEATTVQCVARLGQDVGEVIPYLNADLGGFLFTREPLSVTFRTQGKLITVHPDQISINALRDAEEAEKILCWLQNEINRVWAERDRITPSYEAAPRPQPFQILKYLPKTNCRKCGCASCMVFAAQAVEGGKGADDCPEISPEMAAGLNKYLSGFRFDII